MISLTQSWKSLQQTLTRAASAEMTQRARTVLTRELPAWLLEMSALAPVELHSVSADLAGALSQLIRICASERHSLRGRGARRALALKLALDRVAGALAPVETALARTSLALRRSDPRLAAVGAPAIAASQAAPSATAVGAASGPITTLSARECHAVARSLRATLGEAECAAASIQRALRGTTDERDASAPAIAGAIEQTRTLAAWLRQACDNAARQLVRHAA